MQEVPLTLGGKTYKWDLYVAPIEDQLLLGLDFMVHCKVGPLISQNALVIDNEYKVPVVIKPNPFKGTTKTKTYGVGRVKVKPHGQLFPAESPQYDYSTVDMPKAYNPWAHNDPFFIGGRRKYKWNFARPPNPNVKIIDEMSWSQTHTIGGKEFKWDSSLPPDELDSFTLTSSAEDSKECSEITGGKAYSWDFHLAPSAEVSSPSCPFT